MRSKTENLELNIYSQDERVVDWLSGSDQNFQILDDTVGKVLTHIEQNSRQLASCVELNEEYGMRVELYDTLTNAPFNGGTSAVNIGKHLYIFNYEGPLIDYNIDQRSKTNLDIYYVTNKEAEKIQYNSLQPFMYEGTKVAFNDIIYIFSINSKLIYEYNTSENCFYPSGLDFSSTPIINFNNALITIANYTIYIFGAIDANNTCSYKIDLVTKHITQITDNSNYTYSLGIMDNNGENIYLLGGIDITNSNTLKNITKYNIANDTYTTVALLTNKPSYALGGSKIKNNIYLFGGIQMDNESNVSPKNKIQVFDMSTNLISDLAINLPQNLTYLDAFYRRQDIYLVGGKTDTVSRDRNNMNTNIYKFIEY